MIKWNYIISFILRLQITCDNSIYGCDVIVKLESLSYHLLECDFNPKKPVECSNNCGMIIPKNELQVSLYYLRLELNHLSYFFSFTKSHNCIRELRKVINDQQIRINHLTNELYKQKNDIDRVTTDLRSLEVNLRILDISL